MLSDRPGKRLYQYVSDYVIFDLETTGISCAYDAIVEIAAVKVSGGKITDSFSTLVNPDRPGKRLYQDVSDYVIFDLETTGISCAGDAVIEIAALKVSGGKIADSFSTLVNPERPIPYGASRVNGIYDEMVQNCPVIETALGGFLDFAEDRILVGHNIHAFDMKFIKRDAARLWGKTVGNDYIDTLAIARQYLPGKRCRAPLGKNCRK